MTDKKAPTKRRSVSKARLYKEIVASAKDHFEDVNSPTVTELLDAIKDDIVAEAIGE